MRPSLERLTSLMVRRPAVTVVVIISVLSVFMLRYGTLSGKPGTWLYGLMGGPFVGLIIFCGIIMCRVAVAIVFSGLEKLDPWWWFATFSAGVALMSILLGTGFYLVLQGMFEPIAAWVGWITGVVSWLIGQMMVTTIHYKLHGESPINTLRRLAKGDFRRRD